MSYEHRGLVIGAKQKLLYVLPIFSYDPELVLRLTGICESMRKSL